MSNPEPRCTLGIDPGLNGAFCLLDPDTGSIEMYDMPTVNSARREGRGVDVDLYAVGLLIASLKPRITKAWCERVGGIANQGASASFQFGMNTGVIHGVLAAHLVPLALVSPQVWKFAFGLKKPVGTNAKIYKAMSRSTASALAPQHAHYWALAKHDGRAEAFLIATYGSKQK